MGEGDADSPPLADVEAGSLVAVAVAVGAGSMAGKAVVVVGLLLLAAGAA